MLNGYVRARSSISPAVVKSSSQISLSFRTALLTRSATSRFSLHQVSLLHPFHSPRASLESLGNTSDQYYGGTHWPLQLMSHVSRGVRCAIPPSLAHSVREE